MVDGAEPSPSGSRGPDAPSSRARELVERVLEVARADREPFLTRVCAGDRELRAAVDELLARDSPLSDFLERPLVSPEPAVLAELDLGVAEPRGRIGPYEVLAKIGEGGMSEVFLARHRETGEEAPKEVAIKLLRAHLAGVGERFHKERRILESLAPHPGIARLFGTGIHDGRPYFVMEAVDGSPITQDCDARACSVDERLELFVEVCDAVEHAHRSMVVHRDLKPGNILVDRRGRARLLDFGIAKVLQATHERDRPGIAATVSATPALTPRYAAPELVSGGAVTTATDVYSLGVILYQLLTGTDPFDRTGLTLGEILDRWRWQEPAPPSRAVADLGRDGDAQTVDRLARRRGTRTPVLVRRLEGDLDNIVLRALRYEPHRRYRSAAELAEDVRRHLDGLPVRARPSTRLDRLTKLLRRHALATLAAASVATLLLAALAGALLHNRQLSRERDAALHERARADRFSDFLVTLLQEIDPDLHPGPTMSVARLLTTGVDTVEAELGEDPLLQARLLEVLGNGLARVASFAEAEPVLERALELRRRTLGAEHPDLAFSLEALGAGHLDRRELELAEPYFEQALELRRRALGPTHPLVATSLVRIGELRLQQGHRREARELFESSLDIYRESTGDHRLAMAAAHRGLGDIFVQQREVDAARQAFEEAVALLDETTARSELARALTGLSQVFFYQGRTAAARSAAQRSLDIRVAVYGPDHPVLGLSLELLAAVAYQDGNLDETIATLVRILELERPRYGERSPKHAPLLKNLANAYQKRGDLEAAELHARQALSIFELHFPDDLLQLSGYVRLLGTVLAERGKSREALAAHRRALEMRERVLRTDPPGHRAHSDLAWSLLDLGGVLLAAGDQTAAARHFQGAAELIAPLTAAADVPSQLEVHARALMLLGRLDEAAGLIDRHAGVGPRGPHRQLLEMMSRRRGHDRA